MLPADEDSPAAFDPRVGFESTVGTGSPEAYRGPDPPAAEQGCEGDGLHQTTIAPDEPPADRAHRPGEALGIGRASGPGRDAVGEVDDPPERKYPQAEPGQRDGP